VAEGRRKCVDEIEGKEVTCLQNGGEKNNAVAKWKEKRQHGEYS